MSDLWFCSTTTQTPSSSHIDGFSAPFIYNFNSLIRSSSTFLTQIFWNKLNEWNKTHISINKKITKIESIIKNSSPLGEINKYKTLTILSILSIATCPSLNSSTALTKIHTNNLNKIKRKNQHKINRIKHIHQNCKEIQLKWQHHFLRIVTLEQAHNSKLQRNRDR